MRNRALNKPTCSAPEKSATLVAAGDDVLTNTPRARVVPSGRGLGSLSHDHLIPGRVTNVGGRDA